MTSFLALANFERERFPSKLVFGEATQVFQIYLMYFLFQVESTWQLVGYSIAALPLNNFQFSLHVHAHGGIAFWVSSCTLWEIYS